MQMKKRISRVTSDKLKLKALKEALRAEGVVTNMAIQQYLLQHNGPFEKRKLKKGYTKNDNRRLSSVTLSNAYPRNLMEKEKHGYKWNNPGSTSSLSSGNMRIVQEKKFK